MKVYNLYIYIYIFKSVCVCEREREYKKRRGREMLVPTSYFTEAACIKYFMIKVSNLYLFELKKKFTTRDFLKKIL